MGKLLQKLVHGIAPTWLSKMKSSANSSPRKLLPFFKAGGTSTPSSKASSPSTLPASSSRGLVALEDSSNTQQDDSSSSTPSSPNPSSTSLRTAFEAEPRHQHESSHHSLDVDGHNHHKIQCKPGDSVSPRSRSGRSDANLADEQPHTEDHRDETNKMQRELRGSIHHSQDFDDGPQSDCGDHESAYGELLGLKRKSKIWRGGQEEEEEEEEEDGDDDEEVGIAVERGASGGIDIKRWVWKRRKGEKGVMSYELPESICSIVGNGSAVVKQSLDPQQALWESMVEMIVGNGLWELGNLEFLLYCYLSLNEPHLHPLIQSSFLQVLRDLERIS